MYIVLLFSRWRLPTPHRISQNVVWHGRLGRVCYSLQLFPADARELLLELGS